LLSALRAFDDVTSHTLSVRYGDSSPQFEKFKAALSYEFDNAVAYRLCCQLRNYSQHAGSPITGINVSARLENEKPVSNLQITLDPQILLQKYRKWQSKVKQDLQKMTGVIFLEPLLGALLSSCGRAYLKLLLSQEDEIKKI
jgi:hypothetical protein